LQDKHWDGTLRIFVWTKMQVALVLGWGWEQEILGTEIIQLTHENIAIIKKRLEKLLKANIRGTKTVGVKMRADNNCSHPHLSAIHICGCE
jgi:hypothetical protein